MAAKRPRRAYEADLEEQEPPYVFYGTPLPSLDEHTRDDGSYVPVWKQEVLDDRGRKRLHGAFTGGFSAGYFNSVGSKEGWTPSTFVSSRQKRAIDGGATTRQKPEDFMDEEDLREAEEGKTVATSDGFAGFGATENDPLLSGSLADLFRPTGETIGVKLLKKMGWKEGQGIGPRLRRPANTGTTDGDSGETHLFAPVNSATVSFVRKTDQKGLGFASESGLEAQKMASDKDNVEVTSRRAEQASPVSDLLARRQKGGQSSVKTGFGVGILNDTGSDDEDPYEIGPKISYSKTVGADKKSSGKKSSGLVKPNPLLKEKPLFLSKKLLSTTSSNSFRKCHDGRLPLDGFILSTELDGLASMSLHDHKFDPPEVPVDWKSSKTSSESALKRGDGSDIITLAKSSPHTAQSRAALLGEMQLPTKSVFDFLSPAARDRIIAASGKLDLPQARNERIDSSEGFQVESLLSLVPQLDAEVAKQVLSRGGGGWMPYADDEAKRLRYQSFLEIRAGISSGLPPQAPNSSKDDWVNEMREFARAAQVFKPVSGLMASRFTSSSTQPRSTTTDVDQVGDTGDLLTKPSTKPEDPAEAAAKMGMFGPLTRSVQSFYPTRLLCKRFNVQPPAEQAASHAESSSSRSQNSSQLQAADFHNVQSREPGRPTADEHNREVAAANSSSGPEQLADAQASIDPGRNDALERDSAGEAALRAVFGNDDEDEDDY